MYFLYIDESYERRTKYLVLGGFIINESDWNNLNEMIRSLKKKYFKSETINLKAIRRKNYDKDENYISLTNQERMDFNEELYTILSRTEFTYMACLIDKDKMERSDKKFIFRMAYSFLIQRFHFFVQENDQRGLIIMDESKSPEIKSLFDYHNECLEKGVPYKVSYVEMKLGEDTIMLKDYKYMEIPHIIEHLLFLDDEHSNHLQVADMICAAISYKFNRDNDYFYKKIENNIRRCLKTGKVEGFGLKFFPIENKENSTSDN